MDVTRQFEAEVARVKAASVAGQSGRLADLFDYLAARGPEADSASQDEIAREVFGQDGADADDATVRVYVHRLRKKLEDFYAANGDDPGPCRLEIPSGTYALRLEGDCAPVLPVASTRGRSISAPLIVGGIALLLIGAILFGMLVPTARNAVWQPLEDSDRPVLVVLGDYYIYGEIDPVQPELSRLIRDFRVDSEEDLVGLQLAEPERYAQAEDVGLNYLPFSTSYALRDVMPVLAEAGKQVEVIPASALEPDMLNRYDLVYVGLLSGMGLLEEQVFGSSGLRVGESYDELMDRESGQRWTSDEARTLGSPAFYRDYAYVSRFTASTGAQVLVIASQRETGLRAISPIVAGESLEGDLAAVADGPFEALVQVTGQQGADLDDRLIFARERP